MICSPKHEERVCAGSDTSEDPIQAALDDLVDPWALDPTAKTGQEADDADTWFDRMDAAGIVEASAARAATLASLDDQYADPGDTSFNIMVVSYHAVCSMAIDECKVLLDL